MDRKEKLNEINKITNMMEHLNAIVDELGDDFVYTPKPYNIKGIETRCVYVHQDCPDCLIGKILHRMGVPLDFLLVCEGLPATSVCNQLRQIPGNSFLTSRVSEILDKAQKEQDRGEPYGDVRKDAVNFALLHIQAVLDS